ncbi:hypothetical protein ACFV27_42880 [Streptomyces antimycoticus]|uniref:hypothetical protein n=1 Tax=Streptomyces antimycoticus TaxID=68175 RepID=UPI0036833973
MSDTILTADETATDDEEFPDAPPAPDHAPAAEPDGPGMRPAHTPGGLPAVPLTVIGANSTVAAVSASVLTAGAPVTGLAAVGIAATAAGAAALRRRSTAKQNANRADRHPGGGKSGPRARHGSSAGHAGTGRAGGRPRGRGNGAHTAPGSAGRSGARSLHAAGQAAKLRAAEAARSPRGVKGAFGAVKAARAERQAAAPTRAERRRQDTADRRNLSDARRAAKAARKADQRAAKGPSSSNRVRPGGKRLNLSKSPQSGTASGSTRGRGIRGLVGSARERMRQAMRRMRSRVRTAKDERTARRLAGMRELRKRAWARWRLWRRLTASALRCYGRKMLAAAISVPFFAIGMITHPIGVRLGWRWLMWPGQRVYARLAAAARWAKEERDINIRAEYKTTLDNAAADEDEEPIGSRVRRAPRSHHAYAGTSTGGSTMSTTAGPGFLFNESASEMEAAAKNYDPDGMMHVHDTIKGFPEALESVAKTFAILAQKADEEFPLEPEVGTSLDAIYEALQLAIGEAEDAFDTFRTVHEQDIRRHEDPRNNAEEGWDTTNNQ